MTEVISSRKRMAQVAASVLWCFTCSGVVFGERSTSSYSHKRHDPDPITSNAIGYAALKPVLLDSGVYSDLCAEDVKSCSARDTRLNFLFTMATVITNVSKPFPCGLESSTVD